MMMDDELDPEAILPIDDEEDEIDEDEDGLDDEEDSEDDAEDPTLLG